MLKQGKVADPGVEAALEDALGLQEELAKGIERFFQFGFYLTISDPDLTKLKILLKNFKQPWTDFWLQENLQRFKWKKDLNRPFLWARSDSILPEIWIRHLLLQHFRLPLLF